MFTRHRQINRFQLSLLLWLWLAGQSLLAIAVSEAMATETMLSETIVSGIRLNDSEVTGDQLMERSYQRHQQFPYIYEEQSLVLEDRNGDRDTRLAKRYTRVEEDGTIKFLLLFDYPEEIRGVALLATRHPNGDTSRHVYLPALGETLKESIGGAGESHFLGTDFSVENLTGEDLSRYHYVRRADSEIDGIMFHVVDVYKKKGGVIEEKNRAHQPLRRHFIRQDNLYITLTYHYDRLGGVSRIQSQHDLRPVAGDMWRADMILMIDKKAEHQSLIKVSRRIYSKDYVPEEVFTADWLFTQYPYVEPVIDEAKEETSLLLSQQESIE